MKRFFAAIRRFFLPPADEKTFIRILPLVTIALLMIVLFTGATVAWEESNSVDFCGLTCHTMPPEYITHLNSAHTNVTCEDCHMGRDRLGVMIQRKVKYSWQTGTAMLLNNYEFPIVARNMAPAREACENCHKPEVFSGDKLVEIVRFAEDESNTPTSTYLSVKTGGGTRRQGLGFGIHWHIENPVYFYATDERRQDIPYVVVENSDGTQTEYIDVESNFDPATVEKSELRLMDCIDCHNRTAHLIESPNAIVDELMNRGLISPKIPGIKAKAVDVLSAEYDSEQQAMESITALGIQYQQSGFYLDNSILIDNALQALREAYQRTHFPLQEVNWETHPNNLVHLDSPGCFRCHDGKHLSPAGDSVRLECNLCHSIPVVSGPDQLTASLELSRGFEPESHKNANWITLHRDIFDATCQGCHTIEDPGGISNTSFCSNSACHGATWEFAGFDAPALRIALADQIQAFSTPTPTPGVVAEASGGANSPATTGPVTYEQIISALETKCGACHGAAAMKGLNVMTYQRLMAGGESGPVVIAGDPENSLLVKTQMGGTKHFGQFDEGQLTLVIQWIKDGALEK